ncbi:MAG TPA: helix-turn-helix domain-containing protein [Solirubrobacteraceae bacterium]|jgi:transposase
MDRAALEQFLADGLSLAEIGRRACVHESTVAYWAQKHGLRAAHHATHAAKGALVRAELVPLIEAGMSTAQIAETVGRSKTTVRHWLREFGLTTQWAERRQASRKGTPRLLLQCSQHGLTPFSRRSSGGYRCNRCRAEAVSRRRRKVKRVLVEEAGGACKLCGYDRCIAALEFHHLVPAEKRFAVSHRGVTRSLAAARQEAARCLLVCANCHAEIEVGFRTVAAPDCARVE